MRDRAEGDAMLRIIPIDPPTFGDRSYVVHDGTTALVIDPQRDIDRVLQVADDEAVTVRHVFETHIHNDYVTGGHALARETGAAYYVNAEDPVRFDRTPIREGEAVAVSPLLVVRAILTPGHTFTHLSYAVESAGRPAGVFSGGSLLFGSTGRPDLVGPESTLSLARAQYASAHRLAALPGDTPLFPTHGFGSFCSATQAEGTASTIAAELVSNPALTQAEDDYVRALLAGLDTYPAYYAHMAEANLAAPATPPDLSLPQRADAADLRRHLAAGEWVVDLRTRTAFVSGHVAGSLNLGLDGSFATYLGWVIPWGTPLTLLGETPEQVQEAQRELGRIGIDRIRSAAYGDPQELAGPDGLRTSRAVRFAELEPARAQRPITVLDVRQQLEWESGHVVGAVHIPFHDLRDRLDDVPSGEVWVHCATGYRAAYAASLLAAAGREAVLVDDDFERARPAGVRLAGPGEQAA
jgi:glyoxylase-like metal-dependent hydrolase (beta-lactamase superfamily II)/rhodanese-related sulfurtransferase